MRIKLASSAVFLAVVLIAPIFSQELSNSANSLSQYHEDEGTSSLNSNYPENSFRDQEYICIQCQVCGAIYKLTVAEAENIDLEALCPNCHSSPIIDFEEVPCSWSKGEILDLNPPNSATINAGLEKTSGFSDITNPVEDSRLSQTTGSSVGHFSGSSTPSKTKILMVLPPQQYQEDELNLPSDYFLSYGYPVDLVTKGVRFATGMKGERVSVNLDVRTVNLSDYAAVVFVGGEGIYYLKLNEDPDYQNLAKAAVAQEMVIGAICLAPWILADAGLLNGKNATASDTDHIALKGAIVSDKAVVRDGNIITGNGPSASLEFAQAILAALFESDNSDENGLTMAELESAHTMQLGNDTEASAPITEGRTANSTAPTYGISEIVFVDPNLEIAIRAEINKPNGTIYGADLNFLRSLDASEKGVKDLAGLEYCINLESLDLSDNQIADLSSLSGLINLESLDLSDNQITDVSPLSGLTNLVELYISDNPIIDESPLLEP